MLQLSNHPASLAPRALVFTASGRTVHAILVEDIDFIEAHDDQLQINAQGKGYLTAQLLADLERQLDPALFMRVHPSCVVNIDRLQRMEEDASGQWVFLTDGSRIPVSRHACASIQRLLQGGGAYPPPVRNCPAMR